MNREQFASPHRFDAYCSWLLTPEDIQIVDRSQNLYIGLTVAQAEALIIDLQNSVKEWRRINNECINYFEGEANAS